MNMEKLVTNKLFFFASNVHLTDGFVLENSNIGKKIKVNTKFILDVYDV